MSSDGRNQNAFRDLLRQLQGVADELGKQYERDVAIARNHLNVPDELVLCASQDDILARNDSTDVDGESANGYCPNDESARPNDESSREAPSATPLPISILRPSAVRVEFDEGHPPGQRNVRRPFEFDTGSRSGRLELPKTALHGRNSRSIDKVRKSSTLSFAEENNSRPGLRKTVSSTYIGGNSSVSMNYFGDLERSSASASGLIERSPPSGLIEFDGHTTRKAANDGFNERSPPGGLVGFDGYATRKGIVASESFGSSAWSSAQAADRPLYSDGQLYPFISSNPSIDFVQRITTTTVASDEGGDPEATPTSVGNAKRLRSSLIALGEHAGVRLMGSQGWEHAMAKPTVRAPWSEHQHLYRIMLRDKVKPKPVKMIPYGYTATLQRASYDSRRVCNSMSLRSGHKDSSGVPTRAGSIDSYGHFVPVISPVSFFRASWLTAGYCFWLYDFLVLPVVFCFDWNHYNEPITRFIQVVALSFWTLDIVITFLTATWDWRTLRVDTRLLYIAKRYMKHWFLFDLLLVVQEWVVMAAFDDLSWFWQMLQLLRLLRFFKCRSGWHEVLWWFRLGHFLPSGLSSLLRFSNYFLCATHVVTCTWYGLGSVLHDGWVQDDLKSQNVLRRYLYSLHWSCARLHGMGSSRYPTLHNDVEILLDAALILLSLVGTAFYIAEVTAVSVLWRAWQKKWLRRLGEDFIRRHEVPGHMAQRIMTVLKHTNPGDANLILADERALLAELPSDLQNDLIYQSYWRIISVRQLFTDMSTINVRVVRHVCNHAMSIVMSRAEEAVFSTGDACNRMLFVRSGSCSYVVPAKTDTRSTLQDDVNLLKGTGVSEAALWMLWQNCGTLLSNTDSLLLNLEQAKFAYVITQYQVALLHATKYAKRFVVNMLEAERSDLIQFDNMSIDQLDEDTFASDPNEHFLFLSHYKAEAGTEATLLRESIEMMCDEDPLHFANSLMHRVFIDSDSLGNLNDLQAHVMHSGAVLLLLTPGVLMRPWVLIEIVTAVWHGVGIVPVEIQRPGPQFQYPDDKYYADLEDGSLLGEDAERLLSNEGISLSDVEFALRRAFSVIALPFSPHKSKVIRDAELCDILKRAGEVAMTSVENTMALDFSAGLNSNRIRLGTGASK